MSKMPSRFNSGPVVDLGVAQNELTAGPVLSEPMKTPVTYNEDSPFTNKPAEPVIATSAPAGFGPTGSEKKFPFGEVFQLKALGIILRIPSVLQDFCDDIKPGYFTDPIHQTIFRLIQGYFQTYRSAPTEEAISELIRQDAKRLGHSDDFKARLATVAAELYQLDLTDVSYLQDRISNFVKFRKALEVTLRMADIVDELDKHGEGDFDKVIPLVRELNSIGAKGGTGFEFGDNIEHLPEMLLHSENYSSANKVPIGFEAIDHMLDGGMGWGEIFFFVAGGGVGKSTALVNSAVAAALAGVNVLIVTAELKEADYALRCAQRLTMCGKEHVINKSLRYQERSPYIKDALQGRIHVKYYPPGRATVDTLRSYMSQLLSRQTEQRQWLVIIDYLEKLKLGDGKGNREDWALIGDVTNELIAFGHEFKVPVLSASQTNRSGYAKVARGKGKTHTDKDDIGSSWKKIEHADGVLAFDQSEIEKAAGIARVRALKIRRGQDGFAFRVKDQRPIMRFVELTPTGEEILSYSPRRRDGESLNLILANWDQETPYTDESAEGILKPPAIDIRAYHKKQLDTLLTEVKGLDLDDLVAMHDGANAADIKLQLSNME